MRDFRQENERGPERRGWYRASLLVAGLTMTLVPAVTASAKDKPKTKRPPVTVTGTDQGEEIALRLAPGDPAMLLVDFGDDGSAELTVRRKKLGGIVVEAGGGDDVVRIDHANGAFAEVEITIRGETGEDTLRFTGSEANETVELFPEGSGLGLSGDLAGVTAEGIERVRWEPLEGADAIVVNDLTGSGVAEIEADLAAAGGGGDGEADTLIVDGTNGDDVIQAAGGADDTVVSGLAALLFITSAEPEADVLVIHALGGDDVVDANGLAATAIALRAFGGDGDDVLIGGAGDDVLAGEGGDDVLIGDSGADQLSCGPGDDVAFSGGDPGDVVDADCE